MMAAYSPIAITGMGGRFPGEGDSLPEFWQSICAGKSAWSKVPTSRFNAEAFWSGSKKQNTSAAQAGHFLTQDVSKFDANFFSFPKKDVQAMDPQHRIMVEVAYESLENAGLPLGTVAGSKTGVFIGHFTSDYKEMIYRDPENAPQYTVAGACQTSLANRISWMWDLRGPSFSVDTACSSSLVALHLACQSLRTGESDIALVGGTNLLLNPEMFRYLSNQSFLSPDGKCKSFDESANGYGRGEGCGCLVLKRVDDAISAGDPIRAVIRGTGSNQDGRTKGMTLPSAEAQETLIKETYQKAGVDFTDVGYVEAHGTGTQAGDKTEVEAIGRTITMARGDDSKLLIGSVKSNIGHLEAAAGVASVIKSVFILENGIIPPSINFNKPNPKIKLSENRLEVATKLQQWPTNGVRRISTNSFGYGGTNAHAILDDAFHYLSSRGTSHYQRHSLSAPNGSNGHTNGTSNGWHDDREIGPRLFTWSAQDEEGLKRVAASLARYVDTEVARLEDGNEDSEAFLADLAYTLSERRTPLQWKTYSISGSSEELATSLRDSARASLTAKSSRPPRLGFVFTGQGAQWPRMGAELMIYSVFRTSIEAADTYLSEECECPWSAAAELQKNKSTSQLHRAEYSQTLCTVLQVALVDLLKSWNVQPTAVAGHSSGEIGAAYAMGALTREDAWRTAYWRGVLSSEMKLNFPDLDGSMMAAGLSREKAEEWIAKVTDGEVVVACVNSPSSVTISGDTSGIDQLEAILKKEGIFARKLQVDTAYHSPHMQNVAQGYYDALADLTPLETNGECTMHSSVIGTTIEPSQLDAVNWVRNLTSPVQFAMAIGDMLRPLKGKSRSETNAIDVLVEIGPHSALRGPALQTLKTLGITSIPYESVISRNENAVGTAMALAGSLLVRGVPVDVAKVNRDDLRQYPKVLVDLPAYPWNHTQRYWHESRFETEYLSRPQAKTSLLPAPSPSFAEGEKLWRGTIRLGEEPWIGDHKIQGAILYPAAGYIAMALEAVRQTTATEADQKISTYKLRDIRLIAAAAMSEDQDMECIVKLKQGVNDDWIEFVITTSPDGKSLTTNCSGLVAVELSNASVDSERQIELQSLRSQHDEAKKVCQTELDVANFYTELASKGLDYGPAFACATEIYNSKEGQSHCVLDIPDVGEPQVPGSDGRPHVIFPGTLDAAFHLAFAAIQGGNEKLDAAMVPKLIREVTINAEVPWKPGTKLSGFSNAKMHGVAELHADIIMMDEDEVLPCIEVLGFQCAAVPGAGSSLADAESVKSIASKVSWRPEAKLLTLEEVCSYLEKFRGVDRVVEYLTLLHHSNPALSILEVAPKARGQARYSPILRQNSLENVLLTASSVAIACGDEAQMKIQEQHAKKGSGIALEILDFGSTTAAEALEERNHDFIMVSDLDAFVPNTEKAAQNLLNAMKNGGRLCGFGNDGVIADIKASFDRETSCKSVILTSGGIAEAKSLLVVEKNSDVQVNGVDPVQSEPVLLLQPPKLTNAGVKLSMQLSKALQEHGHVTSSAEWGIDAIKFEGKICISLLELETAFLEDLSNQDFESLKSLIQNAKSLFWITGFEGPAASMIDGLIRVVRSEMPGVAIKTLHTGGSEQAELADLISKAFTSTITDDEFLVKDGLLHTSRIEDDRSLNEDIDNLLCATGSKRVIEVALENAPFSLEMTVTIPGDLDSICMEADGLSNTELAPGEIEIEVKASSLSSKDALIAAGQMSNTGLGREAAGLVSRVGSAVKHLKVGDRVAVYAAGAHRTFLRSSVEYCVPLPKHMSFEHASTVISTYGKAWNALIRLADVQKGQSVLIHSAASAIGRAATQIAKHNGLKVFATVTSDLERTLLQQDEGVPAEHIFELHGSGFLKGIKRLTGGRGVDVVLNTSSGEALRQTWSCIAEFGFFIELGNTNLGASQEVHAPNVTYASFDLDSIAQQRPQTMTKIIQGAFEFLRERELAMPTSTFQVSEMVQAMRQIQSGRVQSPSVLVWGEKNVVPVIERHEISVKLESEDVYLLVGGLGGLGRSLASKLVQLGARKLAFLSRSGASSASAKQIISELNQQGVEVKAYRGDVADSKSVAAVVAQCSEELGHIRGVFQCAMVLRDVLFANMTYDQWVESTRPKVQGSWNLHQHLPDVEFFITLSSFSGIFGNPGQGNYAAGGAFEDALAHYRRARGQRAVTLDLGIMRDVGVLAETGITESLREWEEPYGIKEPVFHALLELAIAGDLTGNVSPQIVTGLATGGSALAAGITTPYYLDKPQFAIMARTGVHEQDSSTAGETIPATTLVSQSKTLEEAAGHVTDALVMQVSKLLEAPASEIDTSRFLHSFGIDSLSAIRIVTWALKEVSSTITVFDVLASVPLMAVASKIATKSTVLPKELVPL